MDTARTASVDVKRDGPLIGLIDTKGRTAFRTHWRSAEQIARAILAQCRLAEQEEQMQQTVEDSALLLRKGLPFGILPRGFGVEAEVVREAQHGARLRRFLPGGIKGEEIVYAPGVIRHDPPNPEEPHGLS